MIPRTSFLVAFLTLLLTFPASAQQRSSTFPRVSPNAHVGQTVGVTDVVVTYGRPSVRGREVFGELEPYGQVWRTGANEATTITFSTDVEVEGEPIEAGTYGLFTIPAEDEWTVIFNRESDQWGAYNYDPDLDVLRVQVEPEEAPHQELLTFFFDEVTQEQARLAMHWGETLVPVTITVSTTDVVLDQAADAIAASDDWQTPVRYAMFALQNETGLERALEWVERSIERQEAFSNLATKARILASLGRYDDAVETSERALALARTMDEAPRGFDEFAAEVEQWRAE